MPDFSLRVSEDVQILRVRRVHWLAAVRATYFENKQTANGGALMLNSDGEQIDLLAEELEKVDHVDPITATGSLSGAMGADAVVLGDNARERTASLAPTIASDTALSGTENERLLAQHQQMVNLTNSAKTSLDSPSASGRTTPVVFDKQKRSLIRSDTPSSTTTPPPSLTGSSSKDRSLT